MMTDYFKPVPFDLFKSDKKAFGDALCRSFRETGFAVVSGHTVDQGVIDRNLDATKAFFALPDAEKLKYDGRQGGGQRGYTAFGTENAKGNAHADLKEFWHTGRALPEDSPYRATMADTPSVPEVPAFDGATTALFDALDEMGREILEGVALHLGLAEDWFDDKVNFGNSILHPLTRSAPARMRILMSSRCCWVLRRPASRSCTVQANGWTLIRPLARWSSIAETCYSA